MIPDVMVQKDTNAAPIAVVVNGDDRTYKRTFVVPRFADGVDLSGFSWAVKYANADGEGDVHVVGIAEPHGPNLRIEWVFPQAIAASVGNATCSLEAVSSDGRIWKSGTYTIRVLKAHEPGLEYDENVVSELSQLIADVGIKVTEMHARLDEINAEVANAVESANTARDGANEAAESARNATVEAVVAKELAEGAAVTANEATRNANNAAAESYIESARANEAARNADKAAEESRSEKSRVDEAILYANTARDNAQTAADVANRIAAEISRKLSAGELNGADGSSVTVRTEAIQGGHSIILTDKYGDKRVNVWTRRWLSITSICPIMRRTKLLYAQMSFCSMSPSSRANPSIMLARFSRKNLYLKNPPRKSNFLKSIV